MYRQLPQARHL